MAKGSVNKVILLGFVGDDPETKYTQGGMAVTKLRMATTSVRKDRDGNQQERTEWHRVTLFGKLGEIAGEYLKKGSQIYIEGSIRYDKYTGQDGVERYSTDIIADEMQMLGGRPGERQGSGAPRNIDRSSDRRDDSTGYASSESDGGYAPANFGDPSGDIPF